MARLALGQLSAVAFLAGCFAALIDLSYPTVFVSVAPRERYLEGNSLIHGSRSFSNVAGPSVGALLVQVFSAPASCRWPTARGRPSWRCCSPPSSSRVWASDRLRSRARGAFNFVNWGSRPIDSLVGGAAATWIGVRTILWVTSIGAIAGALWPLPSPVPALHDLPEEAA